MRKYAFLLLLLAIAAVASFIDARPAQADICSAYAPDAVYEEYWGYNRALAGQMMCSVENVSQSVCEAHGGDYKPDNGSGAAICFLPPPTDSSESPPDSGDNDADSAPDNSGDRRLSSVQCDGLVSRWNYLMHDMKLPVEYRRFLANEIGSIVGEVDEPAKACSDVDVYRDIRRQTLDVERQVIMQCGRTFTTGNGGTEDASNIDAHIAEEEKQITESSARICSMAQKQLSQAQQAAKGAGAGPGSAPVGAGGSGGGNGSATAKPQSCIAPHFKLESSYYNGYFENTCPAPVTFDFQSCEITPDMQQVCKKETKSVPAYGKVEISNYKRRPVAENERGGKL